MIVAVVNHKGGVGKTTTAVTLAAHVDRLDGRRALGLDLDAPAAGKRAGASQALRRARAAGIQAATLDDTLDHARGHVVVIDTPPDLADERTLDALAVADVALVPTGPAPEEIEVTAAALPEIAAALRVDVARVLVVLTRVPAYAGRAVDRARAELAAACEDLEKPARVAETVVPLLAAVPQAAERGETVVAGRFTTWRRVAEAYAALWQEVEHGGR